MISVRDAIIMIEREFTPPKSTQLIEVIEVLGQYEGFYLLDQMRDVLSGDQPDWDTAVELTDKIGKWLRTIFRANPPQLQGVSNTDVSNWTTYMDYFVVNHIMEGVEDMMWFFPRLFSPGGKEVCGAQRSRCRNAGKDVPQDQKCSNKLASDEYVCTNCGAPRTLCRSKPQAGRCRYHSKGHHEKSLTLAGATPRGLIMRAYSQAMPDHMKDVVEAMRKDPDYISVMGEMAVLRTRVFQLLDEADNSFSPAIVSNLARQLSVHLSAGDTGQVRSTLTELQEKLKEAVTQQQAWVEIRDISRTLTAMADAERKRIVASQEIITRQEMMQILADTVNVFNRMVDTAARAAVHSLEMSVTRNDPELARLIRARSMHDLISDHMKRQFREALLEDQPIQTIEIGEWNDES